MSERAVLKWNVRVDGEVHEIGGGPVVHAAAQHGDLDEFQVWTLEPVRDPTWRTVRAYPTGVAVPDDADHLATVVTVGGTFVWHLFEEPTP